MLAIIGESGAGKSTTVKALIGDIPSTGVARIAGIDSKQTKKVRHFFGYCPIELIGLCSFDIRVCKTTDTIELSLVKKIE